MEPLFQWAPVINLARDGRWGRNLETPGEDPYVSGEYATSFVSGFQESESDPTHMLASACCKHYVANSVESTTENHMQWNRFEIDSVVTQQDLVDSYMPAFQACVEKGRVSGLMCSLNAVNGVPACANDWLMNKVARKDWGFVRHPRGCFGFPAVCVRSRPGSLQSLTLLSCGNSPRRSPSAYTWPVEKH